MIPETVAYFHAMLLVGFRDEFDEVFDHALEVEEPLSDLILALSTCISDDKAVLSVLSEYLLDHAFDEKVVYHMIRGAFRQCRLTEQMTRTDVTELLHRMVVRLDKLLVEPWCKLTTPDYALELWQEGFVTEEVFNQCFDTWLFCGETLDPWELQKKLNEE